MKSEIKYGPSSKPVTYPFLGVFVGEDEESTERFVVLFSEPGKGIVVHSNNSYHKVGSYSEGFSMRAFKRFYGEVTLKEDCD